MTRSATSPRFAIRIFLNMKMAHGKWQTADGCTWQSKMDENIHLPSAICHLPSSGSASPRPDRKQPFAVLDRLPVLHVDVDHFAVVLRIDLVHELHGFDD